MPRNYRFAEDTLHPQGAIGETYPNGVHFTEQGFPDFSPYAQRTVEIPALTGSRQADERLANAAAGLPQTPQGWTWHHVENSSVMQLVPRDLHQTVGHTGGFSTR